MGESGNSALVASKMPVANSIESAADIIENRLDDVTKEWMSRIEKEHGRAA